MTPTRASEILLRAGTLKLSAKSAATLGLTPEDFRAAVVYGAQALTSRAKAIANKAAADARKKALGIKDKRNVPRSPLTPEIQQTIVRRRAEGWSTRALASDVGVSKTTVLNVLRRAAK